MKKIMIAIMLCASLFCAGCADRTLKFIASSENSQEDTTQAEDPDVAQTGEAQIEEPSVTVPAAPPATITPMSPETVYVDVCGQVAAPGVYQLEAPCRAFQAIEAAGGMLPTAAAASVNQAKVIEDGEQLYIPSAQEVEAGLYQKTASSSLSDASASADTSSASPDGLVNINTADLSALQTLSGIGPSKAQAIIDYREEKGAFTSIDQITEVSGIGDATFEKIKNQIAVE